MGDLISRSALVEDFRCIARAQANARVFVAADAWEGAAGRIENAPAIDAEPVRHGKWICEIEPNAVTASDRVVHVFRCSCCDFTWANVINYFRHCPNCGAKMDGDKHGQEE